MFSGFHIIVVPKNTAKTKRFRISSLTARLFTLGTLLVIPVVIGSFLVAIYYQNEVMAIKQKNSEDLQIVEQKEVIGTRMATLERALSRIEQSIGSLERTMDVELGEIKTGLGPIPEDLKISQGSEELTPLKFSIDELIEQKEGMSYGMIQNSMNEFNDRISDINTKIEEIYQLNADKLRFVQANPNRIPVEGWITSDFGMRHSPYSGDYKMHYGLDIASPTGTAVKAPADGQVVYADYKGGYGRMIVIDHGFGLTTLYGHNSQLIVKKGQSIKRGEVIAKIGSTGSSTGPHLHYEVHVDGIPADPLNFIIQ